jgi:hypothetical protein
MSSALREMFFGEAGDFAPPEFVLIIKGGN